MNIYDLVRNPRDYSIAQLQAMSMIIESLADCFNLDEDEYHALLNCARYFDLIALDKLRDMLDHAHDKLKVVYDDV